MRIFFKLISFTIVLLAGFIALFYFVFYAYLRDALIEEKYFSTYEEVGRIVTLFGVKPEYFVFPLSSEAQDWQNQFVRFLQTSDVEGVLVWNRDYTLVSNLLNPERVGIHNSTREHVRRTFEQGAFYTLEKSPIPGRSSQSLDVNLPIVYEGETLAVLEIQSTLSSLLTPVDQYVLRSIGLLFLLTLLLLIAMSIINHRVIIRPIQYLKSISTRLKAGEFNFEVRSDSRDELGDLIRDFDDLRAKLKTQFFNIESQKEKLLTSLKSLGEAVFTVDTDQRITFANDAAQQLLLQKNENVTGRDYQEILRFIDEKQKLPVPDFIGDALAGKPSQLLSHSMLLRPDGVMVPVAGNAAPIFDVSHEMTGTIVVVRDETKDRAIDRMKTEFISLASHQLRTPLSAIRWSLESMTGKSAGKMSAKQNDFVKIAYEATLSMGDLISRLLNISRIEAGRLAVSPKPVEPKALINGILKFYQHKIKEKRHKVILSVKNVKTLTTDPQLLEEIISNLLSNSIKYTGHNGTVQVTVKDMNDRVLFSVQDSGLGIPENEQKRIFEKFFRADNVVTTEPDGNGLGLYLVKQLVELLEGQIWFESKPNVGTTFFVSFPKSIKGRTGERTLS